VKIFRASRSRAPLGAILIVAAAATVSALMAASASSAAGPASRGITVKPIFSAPQSKQPGTVHFSCQSRPIDGSAGRPRCYQPAQIQNAYGYSGLLASGVNGTGRTILIVDAFSNPYVANDLAIQDQTFGLPAPPSYTAIAPQGVPAFDATDPNQVGWAEEITLDVLWAHAMAPGAKIVLVEAKSNQDADILAATKYAVDNNLGDVISQSFGEAETCVDPTILAQEHQVFQNAVNKGMTVFASSGDSGAAQFNCDGSAAILAASSPASDPLVTGVGGTTLNASDPAGNYIGETAWTEQLFGCNPPAVADADINCSGGGFSTLYGRPSWQRSQVKGGTGRGVPDISYDAGVNGGVLTHCGICNLLFGIDPSDPNVFFIFGGTSAGSPQWAALAADADQMAGHRLGDINQSLYQLSQAQKKYAADFHDVTTGNNKVAELGGNGYAAGTEWDAVTGLGTPNAANLLPALAK
jgi:subtilase family serine protease